VGNRTATSTVAEERRLGSGYGLFRVGLSAVVHEGGGGDVLSRGERDVVSFVGVGWGKREAFLNSFERGDLCEDVVVVTANSVKEELHRRCKLENRYRLIP